MVPVPKAVRVRTTDGWQDVALIGPQGPPGGFIQLGYAELTTQINLTSNSEAAPNDIVSAPAINFDGNPVWVEAYFPYIQNGSAIIYVNLWEGTNNLGKVLIWNPPTAFFVPVHFARRITGLSGSKTLKIRAWSTVAGQALVGAGPGGAGVYVPGFIRVLREALPAPGIPLVTSLPANPVDGQECFFLVDAANGIVWHLKYRAGSASAYKWEFVGGSSLFSDWRGTQGLATTYGYIPAVTNGTNIVSPLAGVYDVRAGFSVQQNASGDAACYCALHNNLHQQLSVDEEGWENLSAIYTKARIEVQRRLTLSAGWIIDIRGKYVGVSGPVAYSAFVEARPVRVG